MRSSISFSDNGRLLSLLLVFMALIGFVSCQKSPVLTLDSKPEIQMTSESGSAAITFTANRDWEVSVGDSWVHVDKKSGSASGGQITVNVTCDPNPTYDDRTSTVTIISGDLRQTVTITQPAKSGLIVEGNSEYALSPESQNLDIEVKANVNYNVSISAGWIKQIGTKALSSKTLSFAIEENTTREERSATISIIGEGLSRVVTVKQDPAQDPMAGKILKSLTLETDYPEAYVPKLSLSFAYDDRNRLTKASAGTGQDEEEDIFFEYSGNTMKIIGYDDEPIEIKLDASGNFDSMQSEDGTSVSFKYDSDNKLTAISGGDSSLDYQWKGNDLYSYSYSYEGQPEELERTFHFEPSAFSAPVQGVDINMMIRFITTGIGIEYLFEIERTMFLMTMPGMIGKRSEHVLSTVVEDFTVSDEELSSLYLYANNGGEFLGPDGEWHKLNSNTIYNWPYGVGSFDLRCATFPYKNMFKAWDWTSEGNILTGATWPLVIQDASVTAKMVVYDYDRNGDGRIDSYEVAYRVEDFEVTPAQTSRQYSLDFSFEYN